MLDWKPLCNKRKIHFKWSCPRALRHSLSLQMFLKSLCSSFGTQSKRSKNLNLMNSSWPIRSALSMLKSLERFWISIQKWKHYHTIKDDGIVSRLKFVRIGEDYQEYRLAIPDVMLNNAIKQSESYHMLIKYSTGKIPPRRIEAKVHKERRLLMSLMKLMMYQNSLSMNLLRKGWLVKECITKAEKKEAARQVHATHAKIMTKSVPEPAKKKTNSRSTRSVVIQDTQSAPKSKPASSKLKLKEEELSEKEEIDWIDSEEDDEKKDDTDDDKSIDLEMIDDKETNDEVLQGKEQVNDDEDEKMTNAEVEESGNGDEEEDTDATKEDAEKTKEAKDVSKKVELPPTSSSLSISSGFGDQFLKLSSDTFSIGTIKDTTDAEISSLLDIKIQSEVPHIQSPSVLKVHVYVISEPLFLSPVQETPSAVPITTLPPPSVTTISPAPLQQSTASILSPPITTDAPTITTADPESDALSSVQLRVAKLEKDVFELKKIDHSAKALATLKLQVPTVVEQYLGSKIGGVGKKQENQGAVLAGSTVPSTVFQRGRQESSKKHPLPRKPLKEPVKEPIAEVVIDDAGEDVVREDDQPRDTSEPKTAKTPNLECIELEYNFQEHFNALIDKLDWNNPEGYRYPFDLSKPLPLQGRLGHLTVAVDYFFNNDLEYLKSFDPKITYTKSITKTKSSQYEIIGIEDMVPTLWSTIKHAYDKDATKHWGKRRKLWYRSQMNKFSKQNVYSTQKILGVKSVSVKKLHGYGHLEEVVVKRANRQLYKFKEGDFVDLHMNDIEDTLILVVQHKLFHLNDNDIVEAIPSQRQ
nr:hypothetical protein [Tanacetum cinerariifolium]